MAAGWSDMNIESSAYAYFFATALNAVGSAMWYPGLAKEYKAAAPKSSSGGMGGPPGQGGQGGPPSQGGQSGQSGSGQRPPRQLL